MARRLVRIPGRKLHQKVLRLSNAAIVKKLFHTREDWNHHVRTTTHIQCTTVGPPAEERYQAEDPPVPEEPVAPVVRPFTLEADFGSMPRTAAERTMEPFPPHEEPQPRIRVDVHGVARLSNSFDEDEDDTLRWMSERTSINDIRTMCTAKRIPIQLNTGGHRVRAKKDVIDDLVAVRLQLRQGKIQLPPPDVQGPERLRFADDADE